MTDQRPDVVTVYLDNTRQWRWRRQAHNGAIIADSAEARTPVSMTRNGRRHAPTRPASSTSPATRGIHMHTWQIVAFVLLVAATAVAAYQRATATALIAAGLAVALIPAAFQLT